MDETFWAYLAGFIDGEGSVSMCQNGPRLIITNTYLPTLEWIRDTVGAGNIQQVRHKGLGERSKPCYNLNLGSHAAGRILPKVIPYMKVKKARAEILVEYLDTIRAPGAYHVNFDDLRAQVKERMRGV